MIRFSGLFCMRVKGYGSLFQNIQHRTAVKLITTDLSTVETQIQINEADKINDVGNKNKNNFSEDAVKMDFPTKTRKVNESTLNFKKMLDMESTIPLMESLSTSQIIQILKLLAQKNNRSKKVLKEISHRICTSPKELNLRNCSDLMYSLAKLSYKDEDLLDFIAKNILNQEVKSTAGVFLLSIMQSVGVLKYRNCELIEVLLKNILDHDAPKKTEQLLKSLFTLAVVNLMSPYGKVLLSELKKCSNTDFHQTKSYLDFVWSCVLLNEISPENISHVLSKNYINLLSLIDGSTGTGTVTNLKLQNINAAATTLLPSYDGPTLTRPFYRPQYSKSKSQFLTLVLDGLFHIFPKNGYLKTSKDTNAGFLLDAECCIDSRGEPVAIHKKEGHTKIGIMLLEFNDYCIDKQKTVTGLFSFKQRILEAQGYKIIVIPYTEYHNNLNLLDKVQYLKNKIKSVCVK